MQVLFKQTFDAVRIDENYKQKLKEKLINHKSNLKIIKRSRKDFQWNVKRIAIATSTAIVLLVFAIFTPIMLNQWGNPNLPNTSIEWGFVNPSDPSNPYYCAYKSDKNEFDIDNVILTFYYASITFPNNIDGEQTYPEDGRTTISLFFSTENNETNPDYDPYNNPNSVLIKEMNNFFSEQNRLRAITGDKYSLDYKFAFSEQLQIPRELFNKKSGVIRFELWEFNILENGLKSNGGGASAPIYYKVSNEKVVLSNTAFES